MVSLSVLAVLGVLVFAILLRLISLLPSRRQPAPKRNAGTPTHLMIVLGSGGHTTEMFLGLEGLDLHKYTHRTWVVSSNDPFSVRRARDFEERAPSDGQYVIAIIPRARLVHQSLFTAPASALKCLASCIRLLSQPPGYPKRENLRNLYPNVIVTNGPGTGVIVVLASIIIRFFDWTGKANHPAVLRTIYFESWARVHHLSLSGKLLLPVVDRFIVQWPQLKKVAGRKAEYKGWLVLSRHQDEL